MAIEISVMGLPPKKRTDLSLWSHEAEVPKVINLRKVARQSFGNHLPFKSNIRLRLSVFLTEKEFNLPHVGDLDNFVSGVCDALQAANMNPDDWHQSFQLPENQDVHPTLAIGILNDLAVISIVADRFHTSDDTETHYTITIEGAI